MLFSAVLGVVFTLWSTACGNQGGDYAKDGLLNGQPTGGVSCATPNDGCPCDAPGKVVDCGSVEHRSGDQVTCSMGKRSCIGGTWSVCEGDHFVTTSAFASVSLLGLGSASSCSGATGGGTTLCVGGSDNGEKCTLTPPCPGGSCTAGTCDKGSNDEKGCAVAADCPGGTCKLGDGKCAGGTKAGGDCKAVPCPGGSCVAFAGTCDGGSNDENGCNVATDCPGGTCKLGEGFCVGGAKDGKDCKTASQCPGGICYAPGLGTSLFNPCDPYCSQFLDTPGSLTLPTGGGPPACKAPIDWTAYYATYAAGQRPNGALPTTCTSGPPDNCNNDLECSGGACISNAPATSGSCAGVDFTLSTPCYDGTNFTFQVCNRGTVAATSGILPIAHHNGSASSAASTCVRAVNGPAGQCNVNLAITPLAPGQCLQVTPMTDCGIDTSAGDHFFYVNYSNTPTIAGPVLAECNTCNNFTATHNTAAGVPGAACTPASCGAGAPSGGQYPPNFSSPDGLNTGCAGAFDDVVGGACNGAPGPYSNCGQDFHCDTASNTCKWNVTGDWVDSTCAGVDLTIGAGCNDGTNYHVPVCNRGLGTLASGSTIAVNITTSSWTPASACTTNVGAYHCGLTITQPLLSGQCVDIPGCTGLSGQRDLIVNPTGTIAECTPCNNWAHTKTDGAGCAVACTVPPPPAVQIYGHSAGTLYRVDPVTYAVTTVGTMTGCGTTFDLAIDATGNMYSVDSANKLYKVTYPATGAGAVSCTYLATGPTSFNGLTFTPTSLLTPSPAAEPLHGQANNGGWYQLTLTAGGAPVTYTLKGYYGGGAGVIQSSGDAVGIIGDAEYAVVKSGTTSLPGGDHLWKVNANTGAKITDITPTGSGLGACYGIAYWGGKTYLFCGSPSSGIYTIDTSSGSTTLVKATPTISWYGAAVTTTAPTVPPTPSLPPPSSQYFTRDYQAVCPTGTRVAWSFFSWQAVIPTGGSIEFKAQTAASLSAFGPANAAPSATPPAVSAGTASVTTTPPGTWYQDTNTVDFHLKNDPPGGQISQEFLRITMKFNTGTGVVPALTTWKQAYDCVPAE